MLMAKAYLTQSDTHACRRYYYKANALALKSLRNNVSIQIEVALAQANLSIMIKELV